MSTLSLHPTQLRHTIDPESLGFSNTSELLQQPVTWIGQERAEVAARFGLTMMHPDYHLFVLGEVGSGRSSLLHHAMTAAATERPVPPDVCFLHNFAAPEHPWALQVPAGQGRWLRQSLSQLVKSLPDDIACCLNGQDFKLKRDRIEKKFKIEAGKAYTRLLKIAESLHFALHRENEQIVFTLLDEKGEIVTEENMLKLPKTRRLKEERAEQHLHDAIIEYFESLKQIDTEKNSAETALQRRSVQPQLNAALKKIQQGLPKSFRNNLRLSKFFDDIEADFLDNLAVFDVSANEDGKHRLELDHILARYQVNLVVDNAELQGAPVIIEEYPSMSALFGSVDYQYENGKLKTDFMRIRAGSLLKAHGGFLMLHLDDVLTDQLLWEKLHRFLRSKRIQIEESGSTLTSPAPIAIEPEAIEVSVKIILIGSREAYYDLQEIDPEFMRRFRVKVDFAKSFMASAVTYHASAVFVAHLCHTSQLPHFSSQAVARLLEDSHREIEDQQRQSAIFGRTEMLVLESAAVCAARRGRVVEVKDIEAALQARMLRHNYPDVSLQEAIVEEEIAIAVEGGRIGQINALTQIDLGDHCFGTPVRVTARTFAGEDGLLNIAREVDMTGPLHDKGVLILQHYLSGLFAHLTPLAFSASIVFEQEYSGIEGDSASCAEFYALMSSLAELPLHQNIAVTGALNQFGDVLPIGGINDKIEGYFKLCEKIGLTGDQGVLIPHANRRHLMLGYPIIEAVEKGLFAIYTMEHVLQGLELLTNMPAGILDTGRMMGYPSDTLLGNVQRTLLVYRRACQTMQHPKTEHRRLPSRSEK